MSTRVTMQMLENLALTINEVTGNPTETYERYVGEGGKLTAQIGNYHISYAYGGASLRRMVNTSGGASDVFGRGHMPKRALGDLMHAFLRGYEAARQQIEQEVGQ